MKKIIFLFNLLIPLISFSQGGITINAGQMVLQPSAQIVITGTGNWTNNGTVTCNTGSTVIFAGNSAQNISGSSTTTFSNITINNTSATGLTLNIATNVAGTFTFTDGLVYSSLANILKLSVGAKSVSGSNNSYVDGYVKRDYTTATNPVTTGIFPLGATITVNGSTPGYFPIQIEFTTPPTAGGSLTAHFTTTLPGDISNGLPFFDGAQLIDNIENEGIWEITSTGVTGGSYTCTLSGYNIVTVNDPTQIRVIRRVPAGNWAVDGSNVPGTGAGTNMSPLVVGRTGMSNTFNGAAAQFGFGSKFIENPLPIELVYFKSECLDNSLVLKWATASESNNDYFTIERSVDGVNFNNIGTLKGAGNSNQLITYIWSDDAPLTSADYYRLKQTDYNGNFKYSNIIHVDKCKEDLVDFSIYPNPANSKITISNIGDLQYGIISISNIQGVKVLSVDFHDQNSMDIDIGFLAKGIYMVKIENEKGIAIKKLVIQ